MRDRLIDFLLNSDPLHERDLDDDLMDGEIEAIADHLLENGVIVPPCKVGDIVYMVSPGGKIHEKLVIGMSVWEGKPPRLGFLCPNALTFREDHIGETVFFTREEAEQALKGERHAEIH